MVRRHTKPDGAQRGRHHLTKEAPIHLSNVAIADPKDGQADARRLQDSRRRPQGPRRQAFGRPDRWLRRRTRRARKTRPRATQRPPQRRRVAVAEGRQGRSRAGGSQGRQGPRRRTGAVAAGAVKASPKDYVARLKKVYHDEIVPKLVEEFGYKNPMQVPRIDKIVLNMGVGEAVSRHQEGDRRPRPTSR